jgi:hypothetical protein
MVVVVVAVNVLGGIGIVCCCSSSTAVVVVVVFAA